MTATVNANTTTGVVVTSDTSGALALQTGGTTALTVTSAQLVGIGTSSPSSTLDVVGTLTSTGTTASAFFSSGNDVQGSNFPTFTFKVANSNGGLIKWRNAAGTDHWSMYSYMGASGQQGNLSVRDMVGAVNVLDITPAGNFQLLKNLSVGGATASTSGTGITFPASQSASSDANTLDDYEEGTWTPSVGGTATYSAQTGTYTKVGNLVKLKFDLEITTIGTGSTSNITGAPFPSANTGAAITGGIVCYCASLATASLYVGIYIQNSNINTFTRNTSTTGATTQGAVLFGNGTVFFGEITYLST